MRVLLLAQYFMKPQQAGSARFIELCSRLVDEGHEVTVVTGMVDYFVREVPPEYRGRFRVREKIRGVNVLRVWTHGTYGTGIFGRLLHYTSFTVNSLLVLLEGRRFDRVIATSPPLTLGLSGLFLARLMGAPFVFEVRDLWPQAAIEVGALKSRRMIRLAQRLERFLYRNADHLLAVTPGIGRYLVNDAGVEPERVSVVTNGFDPASHRAPKNGTNGSSPRRSAAEFLVLQAGSIGPSDHLEVLVDAAARLAGSSDIRFLVVGDGDGRQALEERVQHLGLQNISIQDPVPRERVGGLYAAADALVCHVPEFYSDVALPNRFLDYLGTGKPIVTSGTGDMAAALDRCGAGVVVRPDDPVAMAEAVLDLHGRRDHYSDLARNRVDAAAREFGWDAVYERYREALLRAERSTEVRRPGGARGEQA